VARRWAASRSSVMIGENPELFPGHEGGDWRPVPSEIIVSWPAGHFAENLAVSETGDVFVSLHSHSRIERCQISSRTRSLFAQLPAPVAGLAFDRAGVIWATGGNIGQPPGYVWRVQPDGTFDTWVEIPDALFMNGCALNSDGRSLLICESLTGRILKADLYERSWQPWIIDDLLRPTNPQMPGANGIKLFDDQIYLSVTDSNRIFRVSVRPDGAAGPLSLWAENLRADDFAFSASGSLYIATHPAQTVMRLESSGKRTTLAGPAEGAVGSTACAFGRLTEDRTALYVTTCGGIYVPYHGVLQEAKLLRLQVGENGTPVPA
jgi:sugar lactone lactonase YvrE